MYICYKLNTKFIILQFTICYIIVYSAKFTSSLYRINFKNNINRGFELLNFLKSCIFNKHKFKNHVLHNAYNF